MPPSDSDVSDDDEETQPPPPPHKTKNTTSNKKGTRHNEDQSVEHQPQSVTKPSKARSKSVVETSKKPAAKPAFTSVKGKRPQDSSEDSETPVEEGPKRPRQTKSMQGVAKQFREERSDLSVHNLYPVPGTSRSFFPGYHSREETPYMMPWGREGVHPAMWPPVPPPDYNQVGAARYYDERTPYQYYNMYGLREPRIHPRHGDTESVSSLCGPQVSRKASDAGQQSASATEKGDSTGTKAQEKESTDINQKASKANPEKQRERSLSPAESADAVELDSEETSSKIEKPKRSRSSHDPSRQNSPVRIRPGTSSQNTDKSSDPEIVFKKQQRNTSTPRKGPRVILPHSADLDDTLDDSTDIPPVISSGATTEPMSPIKQQQESVTLPAKKSILKRSETCTPHDPVVQQLVREAQEDMQENDVDKAQDEGGDVDNQVDQESVERPGPNEEVPNTSSQGPIPVANIVGLFSSKDCGLLAQTLATGLHKQNYYLEKLCEATTSGVQGKNVPFMKKF